MEEKIEMAQSEIEKEVEIGFKDPEFVAPIIGVQKDANQEDVYYLRQIVGSKQMFSRLGEFLSMMLGQDKFYFQEFDEDGASTYQVDMEPYGYDDEEVAEKDMDQDTDIDDSVENKF